jgi:CRISPR-associated endonuclease/helicase Cas3
MTGLSSADFPKFFQAVHRFEPFPWQARLAERVCGVPDASDKEVKEGVGPWPRCIALPTAAGKTACIDIAVFALACQVSLQPEERTAPRRIFFVVDRRVVVDQAYDHAEKLSEALKKPRDGILKRVVEALHQVGADEKRPLDVYALRGGMYRESAWVRSPLQPTVITSTVDQVGSRLLFRGYGVSDSSKPLHAALIGNDSLILLDEAHCARPFYQTARLVEKYRDWTPENDRLPLRFHFVAMSATPPKDVLEEEERQQKEQPGAPSRIFRLDENDHAHPLLGQRLEGRTASKRARLVIADKAKGAKWREELVEELVAQATSLQTGDVRAVGIIVNRVATARKVAELLRAPLLKDLDAARAEPDTQKPQAMEAEPRTKAPDVILLTGRMRPVDREAIMEKLRPLLSNSTKPLEKPTFVVATQTIEVGADLDFHALVTECASLDALRQRFGRLNRVAARDKAKAVIVVRADQTEPSDDDADADPVYGNSLARTWQWLLEHAKDEPSEPLSAAEKQGEGAGKKRGKKAGNVRASAVKVIDFGVAQMEGHTEGMTPEQIAELNAPSPDAAVLLPAHLDMWCQTSPRPVPDPNPSYFLHGPQRGEPEVRVVFRADLGDQAEKWAEIVSLCPPSSSEALSLRISDFKRWLKDDPADDASSDIEGQRVEGPSAADADDADSTPVPRRALRWRGPDARETTVIDEAGSVSPNDTYVVPITSHDQQRAAALLGDFPINDDGRPQITDAGDEAFQRSRDRAILRLTPACFPKPAAPQPGTDTDGVSAADHPDMRIAKIVEGLSTLALETDEESVDAEQSVRDALKEMEEVENARADRTPRPWLLHSIRALLRQRRLKPEPYPVPGSGFVVSGSERMHQFNPAFVEPEDSWDAGSERAYPLNQHCRDVADVGTRLAERSGLTHLSPAIRLAGLLHDAGKADPRFQAWLHGGNRRTADAYPQPLAKSRGAVRSASQRRAARERAGYPEGGRHELASVRLAEYPGVLPTEIASGTRELVLHLIATHHGYCRPFAPVIEDPRSEPFTYLGAGCECVFEPGGSISGHGLERLDSGVAERFWMLTRRYGWWGLPYLEALLRLADWACSESAESANDMSRNRAPDGRAKVVPAALPEAVS